MERIVRLLIATIKKDAKQKNCWNIYKAVKKFVSFLNELVEEHEQASK